MQAEPDTAFWQSLFVDDRPATATLAFRLLRRKGKPFLLLPAAARPALQVLELYPAQTLKARLARSVLRCSLSLRLPPVGEKISAAFSPTAEFSRFLNHLAGGNGQGFPNFGLLAGNPNSPGQRLILLLFDPAGKPALVVKAGQTPAAQKLIQRETSFFRSTQVNLAGVPALRGLLEHPRIHAFALDFFPGRSPRPADVPGLSRLLVNWVDQRAVVRLDQCRVWLELKQVCETTPLFSTLTEKLSGHLVSRTLYHGDLAPWNIRVSRQGEWTALDWERGDATGVPAWDWFHYLIQTGILVARLPAGKLVGRLEALLNSNDFLAYAERSRIRGVEKELAVAYLLHQYEVVKPSEGGPTGRQLLAELTRLWLKR